MEFTAENIKAAGGIRHLCYYFDGLPDESDRWERLFDYVEREWRGMTLGEMEKLRLMVLEARNLALACNMEVPS